MKHLRAAGLAWPIVDAALSCSLLALGVPLGAAQLASFAGVALISFGVLWRDAALGLARRPRQAACIFAALVLLVLPVRAGMIVLVAERWSWSPYAAVLAASLASALLMKLALTSALSGRLRALVIAVVVYTFLLRIIFAVQIELLPEEAYYWNYARHLDIGYLDHPPLVAWLIRLGTALFGGTEAGVRAGALCCGGLAGFFIYRLTRNLFDDRSALAALCLAQTLPYFFLSGLLMTPDAPLTAAWAASLYFLERALIAGQARAWLWAGLTVGIGLLSKYTIALLPLAALVFMLIDPMSRRWLRRWEPYAAALIAAAVFTPVIIWNAKHDWASFAFQTSRRLAEQPRFSFHKLIGSSLVLLTPVGFAALVSEIVAGPRRVDALRDVVNPRRLLLTAILVPLAVFTLFSMRHEVKLDWTGAPWVAALPLLALGLAGHRAGGRWTRTAWPPTLAGVLCIYAFGFYYLVSGYSAIGYSSHTELLPVEWRHFAANIDTIADEVAQRERPGVLIVGLDRYAIASELAFYAPNQASAVGRTSSGHLFGDVGLMYERWFPPECQIGRSLLLVAWDPEQLGTARLKPYSESLGPTSQGDLVRNGKTVRRYYYRLLHGYRLGPAQTSVADFSRTVAPGRVNCP